MDFGVSIELDRNRGKGTQGFIERLGRIDKNARDFTPVFKKIRKQFYASERGIFTSRSEGGGEWAPDTAKTLARKAKRGQDPRVERATGTLYAALARGQGPGAVNDLTEDTLTVGTNLKQAVVAQRGHGRRRRRLIVLSKRRRKLWAGMIRDHITGPAS